MKVQLLPQIKTKLLLPLTVTAAALLSANSLRAQEAQRDSVEITSKEVINTSNNEQDHNWVDIAFGAAFLLGMGAVGLAQCFTRGNGNHSKKA